ADADLAHTSASALQKLGHESVGVGARKLGALEPQRYAGRLERANPDREAAGAADLLKDEHVLRRRIAPAWVSPDLGHAHFNFRLCFHVSNLQFTGQPLPQ